MTPDYGRSASSDQVEAQWRSQARTYNCPQASDGSETTLATDADLWCELRHGRQAADRVAEDRGRKPLPADLDRPSGGGRDPDEAPGSLDAASDDPRPAVGPARATRREVRAGLGHRAARQHLLRIDHR